VHAEQIFNHRSAYQDLRELELKARQNDHPDSRKRISAKVARSAAELVIRNQRDPPKSIFSAAQLKIVDKWILAEDLTLARQEAIRRLVGLGLKAKK
jgi:hypothetical protein